MTAKRYQTKTSLIESLAAPESVKPDLSAIRQREAEFDKIVGDVHGEVIRTDPSHLAQTLRATFSTQLLAYMTGQSERTIQRWARGD